jgi:hypothetical protein
MAVVKISELPAATLPLTGAELAPIVQSNITKKTPVSALGPTANVKAYGATGDGVTDDTAAIQAACTAANGVFFPSGTYKVTSPVTLKSNNFIYGEGASSVIFYTGTATSQGALYANSGSNTAYVENLVVQNLKILGNVSTAGFSEFIHLVAFHGVRNCLIDSCEIVGFRGDGIIIGSGDVAGQERHNVDVTISNCYIDGVNNDNRNGISVIDGNGVSIENNYFTRCTRSNMPGAIDIEPDANVYHVIQNISIRNNRIYDCRGAVGAIGVFLPIQTFTTTPNGFVIEGNYINNPNPPNDNHYGIFFEFGNPFATPTPIPPITDATPNLGVRILNNYVKLPTTGPGRGIVVWNLNDTIISGNQFVGGSTSLIGYANTAVFDLALTNNSFRSVNGAGNYAISINTAQRLTIENNTFIDCGATSGAARGAVEFVGTEMLQNNTFASGANWTTGTGWSIGAGVATKTAGTASSLSQTLSSAPVAGVTYKLTYTITRSAGTVTPRFTGGTTVTGTARNASGTYTEYLTAVTGNTTFEFLGDASFAGTVDNVYLINGWSAYVDAISNTFLSPGGTFTQQAFRNAGHGFDNATNRLIGNRFIAGTNQFEADINLNNNPILLNNNIPNLGIGENPSTYALTVNSGSSVPAASFRSNTGGPQVIATDGTITQALGYAATTYAFTGTTTNHPWAIITNNTPRIEIGAAGRVLVNKNLTFPAGTTTMTDGFPNVPSAAGIPTGVPSDLVSGNVPLYYDSTNDKLYAYNGSWKTPAGSSLTGITSSTVTALGTNAGDSVTTASRTTAIGYDAGTALTSGSDNTAVGANALKTASGAGAVSNTAVGSDAGDAITTGSNCSLLGHNAGGAVTTGFGNTFVGYNSGTGISTTNSNTAVGDSAYTSGAYSNSACFGASSAVTGSNQVQLGDSSTTTYAYGAVQNRSDLRDKTDVQDTQLGLNFIMALRPRDYRWDYREDYKPPQPARDAPESEWDAWREACKMSNLTHDGSKKRVRLHHGLIAQEVKQTMDSLGIDFGGYQDHSVKGGDAVMSIGYNELIGPLIKAMQELKAEFDAYKSTHP